MIKDVKVKSAADDAARAIREGRTIFLYKYKIPTGSAFSEPVSGAAEVIEAIENVGWTLQQIAYDSHQGSNGSVLLWCRKAVPAQQQAPAPQQQAPAPQPQQPAHRQPYDGQWPPR